MSTGSTKCLTEVAFINQQKADQRPQASAETPLDNRVGLYPLPPRLMTNYDQCSKWRPPTYPPRRWTTLESSWKFLLVIVTIQLWNFLFLLPPTLLKRNPSSLRALRPPFAPLYLRCGVASAIKTGVFLFHRVRGKNSKRLALTGFLSKEGKAWGQTKKNAHGPMPEGVFC